MPYKKPINERLVAVLGTNDFAGSTAATINKHSTLTGKPEIAVALTAQSASGLGSTAYFTANSSTRLTVVQARAFDDDRLPGIIHRLRNELNQRVVVVACPRSDNPFSTFEEKMKRNGVYAVIRENQSSWRNTLISAIGSGLGRASPEAPTDGPALVRPTNPAIGTRVDMVEQDSSTQARASSEIRSSASSEAAAPPSSEAPIRRETLREVLGELRAIAMTVQGLIGKVEGLLADEPEVNAQPTLATSPWPVATVASVTMADFSGNVEYDQSGAKLITLPNGQVLSIRGKRMSIAMTILVDCFGHGPVSTDRLAEALRCKSGVVGTIIYNLRALLRQQPNLYCGYTIESSHGLGYQLKGRSA